MPVNFHYTGDKDRLKCSHSGTFSPMKNNPDSYAELGETYGVQEGYGCGSCASGSHFPPLDQTWTGKNSQEEFCGSCSAPSVEGFCGSCATPSVEGYCGMRGMPSKEGYCDPCMQKSPQPPSEGYCGSCASGSDHSLLDNTWSMNMPMEFSESNGVSSSNKINIGSKIWPVIIVGGVVVGVLVFLNTFDRRELY